MLAGQGLRVARRTVTKYRQQLKIAPAQRRHPTIR
jgi:DNA-directed RNA polymerase specialized sigma54-like protein